MAVFERNNSLNMSMRDKSILKRRINKEHNSNFRAGYVHINEDHLHKTGLRGRKTYIVYIFMVLLSVLVIVNLLLTILILSILRISNTGMESLEFIPSGLAVRFLKNVKMETLTSYESSGGAVAGFDGLTLEGDGERVQFVISENGTLVSVSSGGLKFDVDGHLDIKSRTTGKTLFSSNLQNDFKPFDNIKHLISERLSTDRISSPIDQQLSIKSEESISLRGAQNVITDSKQITIDAGGGIDIVSKQGSITVNAKDGIYLDKVLQFPHPLKGDPNITSYKLCICMPSGKLFKVPIKKQGFGCANANEAVNPCS